MRRHAVVRAAWDEEAQVWYVEESDIPGLATEADSLEALRERLRVIIPDLLSDRMRFEEMRDGQMDRWQTLTTAQLEDAGQQELLNWICLAGAMSELGRRPVWTDLVENYIYAAPKAFTVFEPG